MAAGRGSSFVKTLPRNVVASVEISIADAALLLGETRWREGLAASLILGHSSASHCRSVLRRWKRFFYPISQGDFGIRVLMTIFDENYRVVAVDGHRLVISGVLSGNVLVINTDAKFPLSKGQFPVGKLIALSDPSTAALD